MDSKRDDYLSWEEYFIGICELSAKRSKDPNTQVGSCIVDEHNRIIAIGYNGFPRGCSDDELPWGREGLFYDTKYPYVVHAEANAILNRHILTGKTRIYTTLFPCHECVKLIIQVGISEIIYVDNKYENSDSNRASVRMLDMAKISYRQYEK